MTLTSGVTAIAAAIGSLALIVRGLSRVKQWFVDDTRIRASLNRMDGLFDEADRLESAGITTWAAELRRDAWRVLLRRLARFEVNRESNRTTWVGAIVILLYVAGYATLAIGAASNGALLDVGLVILGLGIIGTIVWLWVVRRHERRIVARTDSLFAKYAVPGVRKRCVRANRNSGSVSVQFDQVPREAGETQQELSRAIGEWTFGSSGMPSVG